jgi:Reverse transcriptase (RNA-dependent DNA polymerase)
MAPLKLRLAFQRVRDELLDQRKSGRAFVSNAFELDLISVEYDVWIKELAAKLKAGDYLPGPIEYCNAPKGGDLVRPAVRMQIADRVIYTAGVGACLRDIYRETRWSQKKIDFAVRLNPKGLTARHWLLSPFVGWDEWRKESMRRLESSRCRYVLTADIAGYFENISIGILREDLVRIGCPANAVSTVMTCLNHWSLPGERGLPQGVLASDILAKLYLETFDQSVKSAGFTHLRYSDDVRVFCASACEARHALVTITELLRKRGLTLQSAKTQIRPAGRVAGEFEGAVPAIAALNKDYIDEAVAAGLLASDPSIPVSVVDDLANAEPSSLSPAVMRAAFQKFVQEDEQPSKTMRNYLLRRLAAREDDTAVPYCSKLILDDPSTSTVVLRYFEDLRDPARFEIVIRRVLASKDLSMYPYQQYLVLDWLGRNCEKMSVLTVRAVRRLAQDTGKPSFVQIYANALLGKFGDYADLERIVSAYHKSSDPLERAQLLCCLTQLERGKRNTILGRVRDQKPWLDRAVKVVRSGTVESPD